MAAIASADQRQRGYIEQSAGHSRTGTLANATIIGATMPWTVTAAGKRVQQAYNALMLLGEGVSGLTDQLAMF